MDLKNNIEEGTQVCETESDCKLASLDPRPVTGDFVPSLSLPVSDVFGLSVSVRSLVQGVKYRTQAWKRTTSDPNGLMPN